MALAWTKYCFCTLSRVTVFRGVILVEHPRWGNSSISQLNYVFFVKSTEIAHSASGFQNIIKFPTPGSNICVFSQTIGFKKIPTLRNAPCQLNEDPNIYWRWKRLQKRLQNISKHNFFSVLASWAQGLSQATLGCSIRQLSSKRRDIRPPRTNRPEWLLAHLLTNVLKSQMYSQP